MSVWNWTWNCTVLIRLNPNLDHTHTHTHGLPDAYIFSLSLLLSNQTCCQLKMTMKWNVQWKEALQLWCGLPFSFRCRNFRWIFMRMNRVALSWKLLSLLIKKKKSLSMRFKHLWADVFHIITIMMCESDFSLFCHSFSTQNYNSVWPFS